MIERLDIAGMGERLARIRKYEDKTQREVAEAIGTSKQTIWDLENYNRKRPSVNRLHQLAIYYGVSLDWIVGRDHGGH